MGHLRDARVRQKRHRVKGFRLSSGRLNIHRIRVRFIEFFRFFQKMKSVWDRLLDSLKKGRRRGLPPQGRCFSGSLRSYGRSNSFYAEAIAECLEFIKRSSLAVDSSDDACGGGDSHGGGTAGAR